MRESLPRELRVLFLLRERVPHLRWDARRVVLAVRDFEHVIDSELVAARCADWLMGPDAARVRDAPAQLRRYYEKERATSAPNVTSLAERLRVYDRPLQPSAASKRS